MQKQSCYNVTIRLIIDLCFIEAEKIDTGAAAKSQAGREEPGGQVNTKVAQFFRDSQRLLLGLF